MSKNGHDHDRGEAGDRRRLPAQLGAAAAYVTIVAVALLIPKGSFFGHALATAAGTIAFVELLELLRWCGKGYLERKHLRGRLCKIFATRMLAAAGMIAAGYLLAPGAWLTLAATAGIVILLLSHLRTPGRVEKWKQEGPQPKPKKRGPRRVAVIKPGLLELKVPHSTTEVISETLELCGRWPRIPRYVLAVIVPLAMLCTTALAVGLATGYWIGATSPKNTTPIARTQTTPKPDPTTTTPATPPSSPAPETPPTPVWDGESCPAVKQHRGASIKSVRAMTALYGLELAPPRTEKGCHGQIVRREYAAAKETYFETIGTNPVTGERLSLALDSEKFGGVLVLWSIAALVKAIVARVGPVGGVGRFPYYEVSGGVFYLLRCRVAGRVANIVLIRRTSAEKWVELPPTAARAWLARMNHVDHWLWPSQPRSGTGGKELFDLATGGGEEEGTIHVAPSGAAELDGVPYPTHPAHELNLPELSQHFGQA